MVTTITWAWTTASWLALRAPHHSDAEDTVAADTDDAAETDAAETDAGADTDADGADTDADVSSMGGMGVQIKICTGVATAIVNTGTVRLARVIATLILIAATD